MLFLPANSGTDGSPSLFLRSSLLLGGGCLLISSLLFYCLFRKNKKNDKKAEAPSSKQENGRRKKPNNKRSTVVFTKSMERFSQSLQHAPHTYEEQVGLSLASMISDDFSSLGEEL